MKRKLVMVGAIVMVLLSPISAMADVKVTVVVKTKNQIIPIQPIELCPRPYPSVGR